MEKGFQDKLENSIKKFENKNVKITISGIIESKFYIKKLKYEIKDGILVIEDDEAYLDIDIDDIENLYLEFTLDGYALLVFKVGKDLQIEIQTREDNFISVKEKILKIVEKTGIIDELYEELRSA